MKIRNLKIRNFRGIEELDWALPDKQVFCLIGKGDSTKSTILEAIRYALYPNWNLVFYDTDFYLCEIDEPIVIEVTIGNLIDEFCSLEKYGEYLHGWNLSTLVLGNEPGDGLEDVLIVRLSVGEDLEPHWELLDHNDESGIEFKPNDRAKLNVNLIGAFGDRHLTWGRGSILSQLTELDNTHHSLSGVARSAKESLDHQREKELINFDAAAKRAETIAKNLGVPVECSYVAQLDLNNININQGGLSLHDGNIPLRQLGLGSRRMLICGLQKEVLGEGHITLFDEIEIGLEPHRISRLLKHILSDSTGQYFLTTHSPTALRELTTNELYIVHNNDSVIQIIATHDKNLEKLNVQGKIRSSAEALLANRIIICEGQTEEGLARGLDNFWVEQGVVTFSFQGISTLCANGASNIKALAIGLKSLYYDIAVIVDGDAQNKFSNQDAIELDKLGIEVIMWDNELAVEQRAMIDLPWDSVLNSVTLARDEMNIPIRDHICSKLNQALDDNIEHWVESVELRKAIGSAAKSSDWFKSISKGERWAEIIAPVINSGTINGTDLTIKINKLKQWVEHA